MNARFGNSLLLSVIALLIASDAAAANTGLPDVVSVDFNGPGLSAPVTRWNIDTLAQSYSTPTGTAGFGDMAYDASGRLLIYRCDCGGSFTGPPALYQVNSATGAVQQIVQSASGAPQVHAMTGLADGRLLGYDATLDRLLFIDPATLNFTQLAVAPNRLINSMARSPGGQVYAWASGSDGMGTIASRLYTLNTSTGSMTQIGGLSGLSVGINFGDIAFGPDGRLVGITDFNAALNGGVLMANSAYEINLQTGMPTFLANVGSVADSIRGFEFVPEPSTLVYVIMLLAGAIPRMRWCVRPRHV